MNVLEVENLTLSYGASPVILDATFSVEEGEYICLVGHNGSGKSTLLKSLVGLHGVSSGGYTWHVGRDKLSYLPQSSPRDFPASVMEIVLTGRQRSGRLFYTKEDYSEAENALESLSITNLAKRRIGELSGGQQQRALLARALCRRPKVLVLDEPCAGLDTCITDDFYAILGELHQKGLTVLMASHDHNSVGAWATRVIEICNRITFDGPAHEWTGGHTHE